jgi:serine protease Do
MTSKTASLLLSALLVSGTSAFTLSPAYAAGAAPVSAPTVTGLPDFTDVIDKVGPAVVNIRTTERVSTRGGAPGEEEMQEFLRRFFGGQMPPRGGRRRRRSYGHADRPA